MFAGSSETQTHSNIEKKKERKRKECPFVIYISHVLKFNVWFTNKEHGRKMKWLKIVTFEYS